MGNVAIIPARGGSKRIPRKNIRPFLGKPIIAYSIEAALKSGLFDEVMVSTDDVEIAEIAEKYGAKVPFLRSAENANDFATTFSVIEEVISAYKNIGQNFEYGCCIYPTAPLIQSSHLSVAFDKLISQNLTSIFPVVEFNFPIWRALKFSESFTDRIELIWPEYLNSRSQDLTMAYHDAGQWYWFNIADVLAEKKIITSNSAGYKLPETQVQDIDNETDWLMAELKFKLLFEKV